MNPRYYADYVGFALWHYRKRRFPLYQIIWPNEEGLYPWDKVRPTHSRSGNPFLAHLAKVKGTSGDCDCDTDVATGDSPEAELESRL